MGKRFLFFLLDTPTGKVYVRTSTGTVLLLPITAGSLPINLKNSPDGWENIELGFVQNESKGALFRSYASPMDFVRDAKEIIEDIVLNGVFTEEQLSIAVFMENYTAVSDIEPTYKLFYKGALDLPNLVATLNESIQVNAKEAGVGQLLEAYENTPLQIPCDGSIPENFKVNFDGLKVEDTFFYEFVPIDDVDYTKVIAPGLIYLTNEKDNFGIVYNSPQYTNDQSIYADFVDVHTENFLMYANQEITVDINGVFTVADTGFGIPKVEIIAMKNTYTSPTDVVKLSQRVEVSGTATIFFSGKVDLLPNEKLFILIGSLYSNSITGQRISIKNGNMTVKFDSQYPATRAWAVTLRDLVKLAMKQINDIASKNGITYNYGTSSLLLDNNLNHTITCGDALRASGDINYDKFYFVNAQNSVFYGPVIKTTMADIIKHCRIVLFAAQGIKYDQTGELLSIESYKDSFNSSNVLLDIGEITKFKWRPHPVHRVSDVQIGYAPQSYDQKSGKYETNTTLSMRLPVSVNKPLSQITPYRADPYGIERLRSTVSEKTSTTRNDSDNAVFTVNVDRSTSFNDYQQSGFISLVQSGENNTNQIVAANAKNVGFDLDTHDGTYFTPNKDRAIFIFSENGFTTSAATFITVTGVVNQANFIPGGPAATATIRFWRNGTTLYSGTVTVTGVNTPININTSISQVWNEGDVFYLTCETSPSAEANINTATVQIGSHVTANGFNVPVGSGEKKYISLPNVTATNSDTVHYDYQYFYFNSFLSNPFFQLNVGLIGELVGVGTMVMKVWVNGQVQPETIFVNSPSSVSFFQALNGLMSRTYNIGDIVWFTITSTAVAVTLKTATATWTSTSVKVYNLKRVAYSALYGIPNLATDSNGDISTTVAGAPYNLEDLTPKSLWKLWDPYWKSLFLDQTTGPATFQGLSKNQFLSKTFNGVTITENTDEPITGQRMFYPLQVEGEFICPLTFAEKMHGAKGAHVKGTYFGHDIYFFAEEMKQRPAYNETTKFTGVLSPLTHPSILSKIEAFKIPDMKPNSINYSISHGIQFVPINEPTMGQYTTKHRWKFLFNKQLDKWVTKRCYCQPVAIGDQVSLAFITRDLDPIFYTVYNSDGTVYLGPTNLITNPSPSIQVPHVNWIKYIDTSAWAAGSYYIVISNTTAGDLLVSEPLDVRPLEAFGDKTILIEGQNSYNTQGLVFNGTIPLVNRFRVWGGFDHSFVSKFAGREFVDQLHDSQILTANAYEQGELYISGPAGCPDYVPAKVLRNLMMDSTMVEGEGMKVLAGADFDVVKVEGSPMKVWRIGIEPTHNIETLNVDADTVDRDTSMIVSINPGAMGPNVSNQSGTTDTALIEINVV